MNKTVWAVLVGLLVLGGAFALFKYSKKANAPASSTPSETTTAPTQAETVVPTNTPTATPSGTKVSMASVTLTSSGFAPKVLTVKAGTKVVWTNNSGQTATVNSDPHPFHTSFPPLNLGSFDNGQTLSLVFDTPGTYGYHNHLNPSQKGTVIVQ